MYKEIKPLIENTICEAREIDGGIVYYKVRPEDGYKLHEKGLDMPIIDDETGKETGKIQCGYTTAFTTVGANYDWETNPRQIYAVPIDTVEIIEKEEVIEEDTYSEIEEKAKAYDIITGVAE